MKTFCALLLLLIGSHWSPAAAQTPIATGPLPAPRCMIDSIFGNFHTAQTALGDTVVMLWCDDQVGVDAWQVAGRFIPTAQPPACLASLPAPSWSFDFLKAAWAACAASSPAFNDDQQATAQLMFKQWLPRLTVTGPAPQNLYTMTADGSKGPQLVIAGVGMQVAAGTPCAGKRLQNAGARYHTMSGALTTTGQPIGPDTYAICTITYPPFNGFPTT